MATFLGTLSLALVDRVFPECLGTLVGRGQDHQLNCSGNVVQACYVVMTRKHQKKYLRKRTDKLFVILGEALQRYLDNGPYLTDHSKVLTGT